jgi:hypothetical protein
VGGQLRPGELETGPASSAPAQPMPPRSPVDTRGSCTPDSNKGIKLVVYLRRDNIARHCYTISS